MPIDPSTIFTVVQDAPGKIPIGAMRANFERIVEAVPTIRRQLSMATLEANGSFACYRDPKTDSMWLGFAMGMRCAEREHRADAHRLARNTRRIVPATAIAEGDSDRACILPGGMRLKNPTATERAIIECFTPSPRSDEGPQGQS